MKKLPRARAATLGLLAAAVTLPFVGGCATHVHPSPHAHRHVHPSPLRVVIARGHVHSARCGHYHHRGHWYLVRGHVHGPRCGHVFVGGIWVLGR